MYSRISNIKLHKFSLLLWVLMFPVWCHSAVARHAQSNAIWPLVCLSPEIFIPNSNIVAIHLKILVSYLLRPLVAFKFHVRREGLTWRLCTVFNSSEYVIVLNRTNAHFFISLSSFLHHHLIHPSATPYWTSTQTSSHCPEPHRSPLRTFLSPGLVDWPVLTHIVHDASVKSDSLPVISVNLCKGDRRHPYNPKHPIYFQNPTAALFSVPPASLRTLSKTITKKTKMT